MSTFASGSSEDERWLQEHKRHFQEPEKRAPSVERSLPPGLSGVKKMCDHCHEEAPMESFRAGKCLACQVADYLA